MSHPIAVLAIADSSFRQRLGRTLTSLRWNVVETAGGAEALAQLENGPSQAVILDRWLPDLDVNEFFREVQACYPHIDLISVDGSLQSSTSSRNGRRGELMHAIRLSQEWDVTSHLTSIESDGLRNAIGSIAPRPSSGAIARLLPTDLRSPAVGRSLDASYVNNPVANTFNTVAPVEAPTAESRSAIPKVVPMVERLSSPESAFPEFLGDHPCILEVTRKVRLVAPRNTPVLIQGPSGSGKELVARAIHRLSPRCHRPLVVLNCAAIPESLLEAELFGHTRGAFTGAVQGRVGRIESAHGGTLFLDEIGEMPLALQSKLLRFLEAGEIQRVGDNQTLKVDVRVLAATHQPLAQRARQGSFREDVYYRLAVFVIKTPALRDHISDVPLLAASFLRGLCENSPAKRLEPTALEFLLTHTWPGNVRELAHVLERAYILAETRIAIVADEIEFESAE